MQSVVLNMQTEILDRRHLTDAEARPMAELLAKVFTKRRASTSGCALLMDNWRDYDGPEELYPRSVIIREGGRVVAHAAAAPRTIGTSEGDLTVLGLVHGRTDPDARGRKLGQTVVRAVFDLVDHGPYPHCAVSNVAQRAAVLREARRGAGHESNRQLARRRSDCESVLGRSRDALSRREALAGGRDRPPRTGVVEMARVASAISRLQLDSPLRSTVHSRQLLAAIDDLGFERGEFVEPGHHDFFGSEVFGEPRVRRVMPGFGFEQAGVERGELCILHVLGEHVEPFARAGFDQCRPRAADRRPAAAPACGPGR